MYYYNDICTNHFLERIDERKVEAIGIKYALEYGNQRQGKTSSRCCHDLTTKLINDLISLGNLSLDDMRVLTVVASRGGLTVVRDKKGFLITSYHKYDRKKGNRKPKIPPSVSGNHPILDCITELNTTQPIKVDLSRSKARRACKWYCLNKVN